MLKTLTVVLGCLLLVSCTPGESGSEKASAASKPAASSPAEPFKAPPAADTPGKFPPRASGNPKAAVVVEVFGDFECPHCKDYHFDTVSRLMTEYVKPGKIYLIHRDFVLPGRKHSPNAARWVVAAVTVGKNEVLMDAFFRQQATWSVTGQVEEVVAATLSAEDFAKVKKVFTERRADLDEDIQRDGQLGNQVSLSQTPTVKVSKNGEIKSVTAAPAFLLLKNHLDELLK